MLKANEAKNFFQQQSKEFLLEELEKYANEALESEEQAYTKYCISQSVKKRIDSLADEINKMEIQSRSRNRNPKMQPTTSKGGNYMEFEKEEPRRRRRSRRRIRS